MINSDRFVRGDVINFGSDELDPSPPSAELTTGADAKFKKKEYEPVDYGNITILRIRPA